jgi:D-alanine-D-alanine ligase
MASRVVVLKGGWSAEREVSLVSGAACARGLRDAGYEVTEFDVGRDVGALLAALDPAPDCVFNALHGQIGEDGRIQGLLDMLGLAYTHSGVLASAIAMDKPMAKTVLAAAGIRCPGGKVADRHAVLAGGVLPAPYVVKPTAEGSSVGVHIVREGGNAAPFAAADWPFGDEVLVEPFIEGRELTVAVMGDRPLAVTDIVATTGFYDYQAKYVAGGSRHVVPAELPREVYELAMEQALAAHRALGCAGISRADFRYDESGPDGLYMLEVNTQPGMTPTSLVPEQAEHVGIGFSELCAWLVEDALCRA